jgi:pimeloyl-ACP methyl ester carboxylesterase
MQKLKAMSFSLLCLTVSIILILTLTFFGFANAQNNTLMEPRVIDGMATNTTNIVLIHGFWGDGSSWSKVIPILKNAGHKVIAVQLPLHSLADDIATTKRAVEQLGRPTILVGHSYGGFIQTNVAYNNPNVIGLVYVAGWAPEEGESLNDFVAKFPKDFLKTYDNFKPDSGGFVYIRQDKFRESFAQDVEPSEADVMAVVQKPGHQSIFAEKSGPPAWKHLPTWYQVSENDRMIYPDVEREFAKRMNATTISLPASHASLVSHPEEIAELILNATKESNR